MFLLSKWKKNLAINKCENNQYKYDKAATKKYDWLSMVANRTSIKSDLSDQDK